MAAEGVLINRPHDPGHDPGRPVLIPLLHMPYPPDSDSGKDLCTCGELHPCKTLHIYFDSDGDACVSTAVFERLQEAGLELHNISVVGTTDSPPDFSIGPGTQPRPVQDKENRSLHFYNALKRNTMSVKQREAER